MNNPIDLVDHVKNGELVFSIEDLFEDVSKNEIKEAAGDCLTKNNGPVLDVLIDQFIKCIGESDETTLVPFKDVFLEENTLSKLENLLKLKSDQGYSKKDGNLTGSFSARELSIFISRKYFDFNLKKFAEIVKSNSGLKDSIDEYFSTEMSYMKLNVVIAYAVTNKIKYLKDWVAILSVNSVALTFLLAKLKRSVGENLKSDISELEELEKLMDSALRKSAEKETNYKMKIRDLNLKISKLEKESKVGRRLDEMLGAISVIKSSVSSRELSKNDLSTIINAINETKYSTLEKTFESQIEKLTNVISDLKIENKKLKENVRCLELEKVNMSSVVKSSEVTVEEKVEEEEKYIPKNKFAIICKRSDGYYAYNRSLNIDIKIDELIPESTYVMNGQVIILNENNEPIKFTNMYTDKWDIGLVIGEVKSGEHGNFILIDADCKEICTIKNIGAKKSLYEGQIIGVNKFSELKLMFKRSKSYLDDIRENLEYRNHTVSIIVSKVDNLFLARDAFNNQTSIIGDESFVCNDKTVKYAEQMILFRDKDNNVKSFSSDIALYTTSTSYQKREYVSILKKDDGIFGKKISGELIKLNNYQDLIVDDDELVSIDEFKNILYFVDCTHNIDFIKTLKRSSKKKENDSIKINTGEKILIIGNIAFQNNYRLAFLKEGVEVDTFDGYSNLQKLDLIVNKNKYSMILLTTAYCSHEIMWESRDKYNAVISEHDGANRLVDAYYKEKNKK